VCTELVLGDLALGALARYTVFAVAAGGVEPAKTYSVTSILMVNTGSEEKGRRKMLHFQMPSFGSKFCYYTGPFMSEDHVSLGVMQIGTAESAMMDLNAYLGSGEFFPRSATLDDFSAWGTFEYCY